MDGRIRACFPEMPPAVGYAATATMRCAQPRREGDVYGSLDEQVARFAELAGPPIVVFQDLDDPAGRRHLRRDHVHHLPGLRRRRTDHQRAPRAIWTRFAASASPPSATA